jgi:hypothetical protein
MLDAFMVPRQFVQQRPALLLGRRALIFSRRGGSVAKIQQ